MKPSPNVITVRISSESYELIGTKSMPINEACNRLNIDLEKIKRPWWAKDDSQDNLQFWKNGEKVEPDTIIHPGEIFVILGWYHHDP